MDGPFNHLLHAFIITLVLYLIMLFGLRQSSTKALNRSLLVGSVSLIYMILFGHRLPTHLNNI
jgi:hypothetical protein